MIPAVLIPEVENGIERRMVGMHKGSCCCSGVRQGVYLSSNWSKQVSQCSALQNHTSSSSVSFGLVPLDLLSWSALLSWWYSTGDFVWPYCHWPQC